MPVTIDFAELRALSAIAQARRQVTVNMFTGTRLKLGHAAMLQSAKNLATSGKKIHSTAGKLARGGQAAVKSAPSLPGMKQAFEDFLAECADVDGVSDLVDVIGGEAVKTLVSEVVPVLGVVTSTVKFAKATKIVVEDGRNLYKSSAYKLGFRPGDPLAAAEAVQAIIRRDLAKHSVDLARQGTVTGAKIAGLFTDLGTGTTAGIGLANTIAGVGMQLAALGVDIKDLRAGNRRLDRPDSLDLSVFGECPILGCYLITCADTSAVANFMVADIGLPGWMDKVETIKKTQMDPLIKVANKAITGSRLQLEGLASDKGTHRKAGFFAGIKKRALKKIGLV